MSCYNLLRNAITIQQEKYVRAFRGSGIETPNSAKGSPTSAKLVKAFGDRRMDWLPGFPRDVEACDLRIFYTYIYIKPTIYKYICIHIRAHA